MSWAIAVWLYLMGAAMMWWWMRAQPAPLSVQLLGVVLWPVIVPAAAFL